MKFKDRIISAFENHDFLKAFIGRGDLYQKDPTWGDHDTLLVFHYLFIWLEKNSQKEVINKVQQAFQEILKSNRSFSSVDNGLESLNLIKAYCIVAEDKNSWPISLDFFISSIIEFLPNFSKQEIEKHHINRDLDDLRKYLPGLPSADLITGK